MLKLADLYDSDDAPSVVSGFLAVGISTLFCLGMFMILNSHDASQAAQLRQTVAAVKKSQEDGTDIYTALAQLQAKANSTNSKNKSSLSSLDKSLADANSKYASGSSDANVNGLTVRGATTFSGNISADKDLAVKGNAKVGGNISAGGDLAVTGNAEITGDNNVTGDGNIDGDLNVLGTTTTDSLEVSSDTTLDGALSVASAVTIDDSLDVSGSTNLGGDLLVAGDLAVSGDTALDGALTVGGSLDVDSLTTAGDGEIGGALTVDGATILQDSLDVSGDTTLGGNLDVAGTTTLEDALHGTDATFDGDVVTTTLTTSEFQNNGDTVLGLLSSGNLLAGGGDLTAYGDVVIGGAYTLSDSNNPNSKVATGGNVDVYGAISVHSLHQIDPTTGNPYADETTNPAHAPMAGDLDVEGTLSIGGTDTKDLFIQNADNFPTGTTTQDASINISGDLQAAGGTFSDALNANGGLQVTGSSEFINDLTVDGGLTVTGGGQFDTLDVDGQTTTNTLDVGSSAIFEDSVSINGVLSTDDNAFVGGNFNVSGTTTLNDDTSIYGGLGVTGGFLLGQNAIIGGTLAIGGGTTIYTDLSLGTSTVHANGHLGDNIYDNGAGGYGTQCGSSQHIHITRVESGIVTQSHCTNDADGSGDKQYDLAENYPSTQTLAPGDVVAIDKANSEYVTKSSTANNGLAIGVVSTAPGYTLGSGGPGYPIALSGRVPVKVTNENGPIAPGDYLTSSSTPGHAMKATTGDKTIGQALSGFSGATGTVTMFVSIGIGTSYAQGTDLQNGASPATSTGTFASLNVSGQSTLSDLTVTGSATVNSLTVTGTAKVADIIVSGHIVGNDDTRGTITVPSGTKTIHHDFGKPYDTVPTVVASPTSQATLYTVVPTVSGFDINLPVAATSDTSFSYLVQQ